jgi:hypothetical protein
MGRRGKTLLYTHFEEGEGYPKINIIEKEGK